MKAMPIGLAVLSGLVFPTIMIVLKRRYGERPKEWESFFVIFGVTLATGATGVWLLLASQSLEPGGFWRDILALVRIFVVYGAVAGCLLSWNAFQEAYKEGPGEK